jgi:hypothetical protein
MEEHRMPKKIFAQELEGARRRERPRKRWKEEVERDLQVLGMRRWRKLVTDRKKMEGYCSTGQSPQRAVVPMEKRRRRRRRRNKFIRIFMALGRTPPSVGECLLNYHKTSLLVHVEHTSTAVRRQEQCDSVNVLG